VLRFRWLMLLAGIALFLISICGGKFSEAFSAFIIGMIGGFIIDCVGCGVFHFWDYPRQPFPSMKHLFIVVPSWGIFAMTINLLWERIENPWLVLTFLFLGQMAVYEIANRKTRSWIYFAPRWLVVAGWFPLVLYFRLIFIVLY